MSAFARRAERVQPSAIREFLALSGDPRITSFAGGYPDASLFPVAELRRVYDDLLSPGDASALQYAASDGLPVLRALVAARLTAAGTPCEADDVLITQGGQQGLDLTAKLFVDPGDVVVVERPTFLGALIAFNPYEPDYRSVPMDDEGLDTDALEEVLRTTDRVKLVYTVPDFHNPTGRTMSLARRHRLVELAQQYDVTVLEDTPYRELRYDGETLPTLRSLDDTGRVVHLGSFSKILAPGLRLGWALAAPGVRDRLSLLKLGADTQNGTLSMRATAAYLGTYDIDRHVADMLPTYRHQRDLMLATMEEHFPVGTTWTRSEGGLFTWVTFPERLDVTAFQRDVLIPRAGIIVVPGEHFYATEPEGHHARLSYSGVPDEKMVAGLRTMGELLREALG